MKSIGFVDYYISEWHANNYPQWIKEACQRLGLSYEVKYAYAKLERSLVDNRTTDEWCSSFNVIKCKSIKEICEKSDNIFILAPSNPEEHLKIAKELFPYAKNKRIYIDKTFATNLKETKEIYSLADKYNISFFSTSALRYAEEIKNTNHINKLEIFGGGGNFDEYIIHQVEMLVKMMGVDISTAKVTTNENVSKCEIRFCDGRVGYLSYSPQYDFAFKINEGELKVIKSNFFELLIGNILLFFENGEIDFKKEETITAMALREALIESKENNGKTIRIK